MRDVSPVRLLELGAVPPLYSQALYHGLAESMRDTSPDTLVLCWPSAPCFCVGAHRRAAEDLDLDWCQAQGYPVLHRRIGGGTVYLHPGQLFYQAVVHRRRAPFAVAAVFRRCLDPVVRTLAAMGLDARLEGVNEIEVGGRRIAGTGGGQLGEAMVVVGNLLYDFPAATMGRAWRLPSEAFRRLAVEGLHRHLVTLDELCPAGPPDPAELGRRLAAEYAREWDRPMRPGEPTPDEAYAVGAEERRLVRLGPGRRGSPERERRLKLTRRAWVGEWTWSAGAEEARVTARVANSEVEALEVVGPLRRAEALGRVAALVREARPWTC